MAKKLNQNILIETIDLSAGTQQRPLCQETVTHYENLRKDGVVLPPVELIWSGQAYYLTDGFHRVATEQNLGNTHIRANVIVGNIEQAIWLSYAANSQHGLPRPMGATKEVIDKILKDPKYAELKLIDIASHVGCSRQYVYRRRKELLSTGDKSEPPSQTAAGSARGRAAQEPPQSLTDDEGQLIPPPLVDRFLSRSVIRQRINEINKITNTVKHKIEDGDLTYALLNQAGFKTDANNFRNRLKAAIPYAICPYCKGEACGACHQMGFLNRDSWKAAPKNGEGHHQEAERP